MTRQRFIILPLFLGLLFALVFCPTGTREVQADNGKRQDLHTNMKVFVSVLKLVNDYYVEEVGSDSLIEGAIEGMLKELDPHSNYIKPKRYETMSENYRGTFSGIGVNFLIREGWLTVISAIEGGPSREIGIRAGDVITHIDGVSAEGISQDEVFDQLRGPRGTVVNVSVRRGGETDLMDFDIVRDDILLQSVPYAFMVDPGIGYIRMGRFSATTSDELETGLQKLEGEGMTGLILDLRGNSGGYLHQAVAVVDKFLDRDKMVVYTKGRRAASSEEYFSTPNTHADYPIVVLINPGSASASEIVAGALQDWDRGLIAGRTSFGKGLVQQQYPLANGGALLLTASRYYTPSGRLIQRPYEAGERDEYYMRAGMAAGDEEDLEITEAETDEHLDSDNDPLDESGSPDTFDIAKDETADGRPIFHTLIQNRPVFGGGGITPDVDIEAIYRTSRLDARLARGRKYFDFANSLIADKVVKWDSDFQSFINGYQVDDDIMNRLSEFLVESEFEFEADSLAANGIHLRRGIRAELANRLWGEDERYRILIQDDPAVHRAIELLPQALELLNTSQRIEEMRAQSGG
jgi:carboxyl-terminal processing protease